MTALRKRNAQYFALLTLVVAAGAWIGFRLAVGGERAEPSLPAGAGTLRARVVDVVEEGKVTLGDREQAYQVLLIEVLEGERKGEILRMEYGRNQPIPLEAKLSLGETVLVSIGRAPDGRTVVFFADYVRTAPMVWLALTFVAFTLVVSRWKGVRGLLGMAFSFAVIVYFILPQILAGRDPLLVSIAGSAILLASTLYLVYGWTLKSHTAVVSILIALLITGALASAFVGVTRLTGFGSEEALFLTQSLGRDLNARGLLLGGIIIGALGVLDDLTISQVSAVFELHRANPELSWRELYGRAMNIGQDHIAATVNTLVLAYVGASLPLLLLFTLFQEPFAVALNRELVAEEVVRTLVGSLGLISAVPLSTFLATSVALRRGPAGLGAEGRAHTHAHR